MPSAPPAVLRLALPLPLPQLFDYLPPAGSAPDASWIGCRVQVPFGRRSLIGIVAEVGPAETAGGALREAGARLDAANLFGAELWRTLLWASGYYCRALGDVLSTAMPALLRLGRAPPEDEEPCWSLTPAGHAGLARLRAGGGPARVATALASLGELDERGLAALGGDWRAALRSLVQRGWVARHLRPRQAPALPGPVPPQPNPAQQQAIGAVTAALGGFQALLLDGVTGSGKTEVYLGAIEAVLARGRQALVLVPEIGLTPQALRRYGERLPVPVYALHSGLNDAERARAWQAMASGRGRVLVGTRSAIFTPLPDAGLIIVDEEHDTSYKQQDGFRYHARDLALVRAKALSVPALLGSATPSLESLHNVQLGTYRTLRLPARAGVARPPQFHVVDIRSLPLRDGLSAPLRSALHACLERGEQALVFRNRRGFAPCLLCHDCARAA